MKNRRFLLFFALMITLVFATACEKEAKQAQQAPEKTPVKVAGEPGSPDALARVGDGFVTKADFDKQVTKFPPNFASTEPGRLYVVNQLVDKMVIEKEAAAQGWSKDPAIVAQIEGFTLNLYRNALLQSIKQNQTPISDEEVKKFYKEHADELAAPERVRISLIEMPLDKQKEIDSLYKQIKAGKDFAELARANSIHMSAKNGGDLGFLNAKLYKPLTEVAFAMKTGEVSKPIKTTTGWNIIKVTDFQKKEKISEEEGLKRARAKMEAMRASKAYEEKMNELRQKNNVAVFEPRIKEMK